VQAIRNELDAAAYRHLPIPSYAARCASAFYGPFREAAEWPPQVGDRGSYQMGPANGNEALGEVAQDLAEGTDLVMVKPAPAYLDIVHRVKERFGVPVAAYNVSGEFAMVKAAQCGRIDERKIALETFPRIKRAGCGPDPDRARQGRRPVAAERVRDRQSAMQSSTGRAHGLRRKTLWPWRALFLRGRKGPFPPAALPGGRW
jgi:hypothetical protein